MVQQFTYIQENIKSVYKRKIVSPAVYLVLLVILSLFFPISQVFVPVNMSDTDTLSSLSEEGCDYLSLPKGDYYFTGYTSTRFGQTIGYYYYTIQNHECMLVLLSPRTCEQGLPTVTGRTISGKLMAGKEQYDTLIANLSADLSWTKDGMAEQMSPYLISEPALRGLPTTLFLILLVGTGVYALLYLFFAILFHLFPLLSPPCTSLGRFGHSRTLLAQAEEELATLPQLATEDMFITEHFFIEISRYGVAIVPIKEIIWVYKHSTLHKFLWYHFAISYTLHIVGNKHFYIQCPRNIKSDIDGIMDYLAEANHQILVGFNEENRLKVQDIQNRNSHMEGLFSFFRKQIK